MSNPMSAALPFSNNRRPMIVKADNDDDGEQRVHYLVSNLGLIL
jgi:hypothetical protein